MALIPRVIRENLLGQLFAGLVVILLLSGLTAWVFVGGVEGELETQVDTQAQETANLQADIYAAWFESRESDLSEVGSDLRAPIEDEQNVSEFERDLQSNRLNSSLLSKDEFTAFHLVDPETGEILASSHEAARDDNETFGPDTFRAAEAVTGQYTSPTGETVVAITDPLGTQMGEILVGEVDAASGGPGLSQTIEGSKTTVVKETGKPVLGTDRIERSLLTESRAGPVNRDDWVVASARLENDLTVVTQSPEQEAFAVQQRVLRSFLITLVVTFGVLSIIIAIGGRSVQKSLNTLATKAREMEEGDLEVEFSTRREDEIGDLYGSFDAMRDALREQLQEVRRAQKEAEQFNKQLQVVGRILRHNLRNDLNTVKMSAELIEQDMSDSTKEEARQIQRKADTLLETADKQHELTNVLRDTDTPEPYDIGNWLRAAVKTALEECPSAEIAVDIPASPRVLTTPKLEIAIVELLENAIVHSDRETPQVELRLERNDETVEIVISDDGPGIPEIEREVLGDRDIDPLSHGSSIGLWLAYVIVRQSGGTLRFETREPRGTDAIVELQRADE